MELAFLPYDNVHKFISLKIYSISKSSNVALHLFMNMQSAYGNGNICFLFLLFFTAEKAHHLPFHDSGLILLSLFYFSCIILYFW